MHKSKSEIRFYFIHGQIYLKALISFTINGLVVRLWVCASNVGCSYPARVICCNFIYNKTL